MRMMYPAVLILALTAFAGGASAQSGLHNETEFNDKLLIVAVVDKVNRGCDSLGVKFFKARGYLNSLKAEAKALGYSRSEVDAYTNDKGNKAKMRKRRDAYFVSQGASSTDPESLCVFGHAEIQKQSQIGVLLRAK